MREVHYQYIAPRKPCNGRECYEIFGRRRSAVVAGGKTSVSLEDALWNVLKEIASERDITVSNLISG
jgi:predicted DNA-binding ribbon-helix-helix protein